MCDLKMAIYPKLRVLITNCFEADFPLSQAIIVCQGLEYDCDTFVTTKKTHLEYRKCAVKGLNGNFLKPLPFTEKEFEELFYELVELFDKYTVITWPDLCALKDWVGTAKSRTYMFKKETKSGYAIGEIRLTKKQIDELFNGGINWNDAGCIGLSKEQYKQATKNESCAPALRYNADKVPYAYLPLDLLDGVSKVMLSGAKKYKDGENYRKGYPDLKDPLSSLMRHISELQRAIVTEDKTGSKKHLLDDETGLGHVHHVITSTLLLLHSMRMQGYKV